MTIHVSPVILTPHADHFVTDIQPSDLSSVGSLFSARYELHAPSRRNLDEFQSPEVAVGQTLLRLLRFSPVLPFFHTFRPSTATALIRRTSGRGLGTFIREAPTEKQIHAASF